ncbi:MAG: cytochrome c3 family protein [Thermoguttaceae bacterium]
MQRSCWLGVGYSCMAIGAGTLIGLAAGRCATAAPPLSIEHLLNEALPETPKEPEANAADAKPAADNEACFVCHGNYREEPFALVHARDDVGCVDCHGESLDHRNDEDNVTPPDRMYAAADIEDQCAECHETHDAPAADVIARWQESCPAKTDPARLVCTDCHGQHRLKFRTVWWDKKTGKLGGRKEGERTRAAPDLKTRPQEPKAKEPQPAGIVPVPKP